MNSRELGEVKVITSQIEIDTLSITNCLILSLLLSVHNPAAISNNEGFTNCPFQIKTIYPMINMFINVTNRTSSAIQDLQVDALNSQAIVTFKNGNTYVYGNVSKRAILNVTFNPDVSLGFWVNNNLVKSDRAEVLNGDEFDYSKLYSRVAQLKNVSEPQLPSFV